ncbi:Uncharacterized protein Rs2_39229 [Raphanus sativus]|nr:Uncharacterized protein Rs2_39229 [Raphanus sativus]
MVKTKFTRNGREVIIFGGMRNFDYEEAVQQSNKDGNGGGSEEVVQPAKKSGEAPAKKSGEAPAKKSGEAPEKKSGKCGASVSLSPERSRKSKRVEGIEMLASTPPSKTRRETTYGSPAKKGGDGSLSYPEKTTRRGTSYGGSPPNSKKKQTVTTETVARPGNSKKKQTVTTKTVTVTKEGIWWFSDK